MRVMFASLKKLRFAFGLLLWFHFVLIVSYFSLARTAGTLPHLQTARSDETITNRLTPRASVPNLAIDTDGDGLPDTPEMRSFNDRENFRRCFAAIAEMQF